MEKTSSFSIKWIGLTLVLGSIASILTRNIEWIIWLAGSIKPLLYSGDSEVWNLVSSFQTTSSTISDHAHKDMYQ